MTPRPSLPCHYCGCATYRLWEEYAVVDDSPHIRASWHCLHCDKTVDVVSPVETQVTPSVAPQQDRWPDVRVMLLNLRKAALLGENAGDIPEMIDDVIACGDGPTEGDS